MISTFSFLLLSWVVRKNYIRAKRDVVRLQYISLSPVIGLCCSSVVGAPIIRSLNKQDYFSEKTRILAEENSKNAVASFGLDAWYETRLALLNLMFVFIPQYTMIIFHLRNNPEKSKDSLISMVFFMQRSLSFISTYTYLL